MEWTASSRRLAANILNKQPRTNDKGWSSSLGVGRGAKILHRKKQTSYETVIGRKARGKETTGKTEAWWMDKINTDLLYIGLNVVDWIGLAKDRYRWRALVNSVMNLRVP
jgi:hypothetical protein